MRDLVRTIVAKLRQARRLLVRAQLTWGLLQVVFWTAVVASAVGATLSLRRRVGRPSHSVNGPVAQHQQLTGQRAVVE